MNFDSVTSVEFTVPSRVTLEDNDYGQTLEAQYGDSKSGRYYASQAEASALKHAKREERAQNMLVSKLGQFVLNNSDFEANIQEHQPGEVYELSVNGHTSTFDLTSREVKVANRLIDRSNNFQAGLEKAVKQAEENAIATLDKIDNGSITRRGLALVLAAIVKIATVVFYAINAALGYVFDSAKALGTKIAGITDNKQVDMLARLVMLMASGAEVKATQIEGPVSKLNLDDTEFGDDSDIDEDAPVTSLDAVFAGQGNGAPTIDGTGVQADAFFDGSL